jgi:long-chain acyl-CoA synthetase
VQHTLGEMLSASAREFGDRPLVVCADRTLSARELDDEASRLAAGLRSLGLRPGDRITLWMENGWRWMVAYYATLRLGGVVVPCNILLTADEVGFIVGDSGSKAMIVAHDKIAGVQGCPGVLRIVDRPGGGNAQPDLETLLSDP